MRNVQLDESQAEIKIARRSISNLRYADDTTLIAESEEELKSLLTSPALAGGFSTAGPPRKSLIYTLMGSLWH